MLLFSRELLFSIMSNQGVKFPDFDNVLALSKANGTIEKDGWLYVESNANVYAFTVTINSFEYKMCGTYANIATMFVPVLKGDTYSCSAWGSVKIISLLGFR